jgi:uncharacterized phage-associated protein
MVEAQDAAKYMLLKHGPMTTWKLQKLLHYAQAWHLVWDDEPLFPDRIEAWANGPVVKSVYQLHRRKLNISEDQIDGDADKLSPAERGTVDAVLANYGPLDGRKLSHLTHAEDPRREARGELPPTAPCENEITTTALQAYYGAVDAAAAARPVEEIDWESWEQSS